MPYMEDSEVFKSVKASSIAFVYYFFGQEKYFMQKAVAEIQKKVVTPQFESFNYKIFNGEKLDLSKLEDEVYILPMMANKKCILIKDIDIEKLVKADLDKLVEIISTPIDSAVIILTSSVEVNIKKSAKIKKFADIVAKNGVVCDFALKDKLSLKRALCERAKKVYIELDMETAEYLIDRSGMQYSVLINELDKLISYVGEGEITKKHIDDCTIKAIDSSAFDLAKSILVNNFNKAFILLDELFTQREEPIAVLSALSMAFTDLYRAKCATIKGSYPEDVAKDFNYPKNRMFAIKNSFRDVNSFSSKQIRSCIDSLHKADILLKSSKLDNRIILEQMLGEMQSTMLK